MATAIEEPIREKEEARAGDMSLSPHPLCVHALSSRKQNRERIASKTPVIQIVIVTLHPQMTSALCLCRFRQPQALRSFPLRYLSNAYNRVTSSFSEGYFLNSFLRHQNLITRQLLVARASSNFDHVPASCCSRVIKF